VGVEDDQLPTDATPADLRLASRIAGLAQDPSDEARARIMAAVRSAPMPVAASGRRFAAGRWRPVLAGLGATGVLLFASAGALAASSDALPNSPAYGLRRFEENLRVAVADPPGQLRLHLQFAADKVRQAKEQVTKGDAGVAAELLSDCRHDLHEARVELQAIHDPTESPELATEQDRVQSDASVEQTQVDAIVNGGEGASPSSEPSPTPSDESVPTSDATASPLDQPTPSPDTRTAPSPDATPTPY
jgi:hypothetical protein